MSTVRIDEFVAGSCAHATVLQPTSDRDVTVYLAGADGDVKLALRRALASMSLAAHFTSSEPRSSDDVWLVADSLDIALWQAKYQGTVEEFAQVEVARDADARLSAVMRDRRRAENYRDTLIAQLLAARAGLVWPDKLVIVDEADSLQQPCQTAPELADDPTGLSRALMAAGVADVVLARWASAATSRHLATSRDARRHFFPSLLRAFSVVGRFDHSPPLSRIITLFRTALVGTLTRNAPPLAA